MTNKQLTSQIDNFVRQMPELALWKDSKSNYRVPNDQFRELLGFKSEDECVGSTDFDMKCDANEFANKFRAIDNEVIETSKDVKTFEVMKFNSNDLTIYLMEKSPIHDFNNNIIGVLCIGTLLKNALIKKILSVMAIRDFNNKSSINNCNVYSITNNNCQADNLPVKQSEILFFLLSGLSNKEISSILCVSIRTVEAHISILKCKFKCITKYQLIDFCIEKGFLYEIPKSLLKNEHITKQTLNAIC